MKKTVGVIVGRFQLAELHAGHCHLIDVVTAENDTVFILLGNHGGQPTDRNPLSYEARRDMILSAYPAVTVVSIEDFRTNEYWSAKLDELIENNFPEYTPVLYGSRDSFLESYRGAHEKRYVEPVPNVSGTALRAEITEQNDPLFRQGAIHAVSQRRYPIAYSVIDVAVIDRKNKKILLGRKMDHDQWQFIGGFVDPSDANLEAAVLRELREETGEILVSNIAYVGSLLVDDHRYVGASDGVMSVFFSAEYESGRVTAGDDLDEVAWFDLNELPDILVPAHRAFSEMLSEQNL